MSPSISPAVTEVLKALDLNSRSTPHDKIAVLQTFNSTTLSEPLSFESSIQMLNTVPLGLFYNAFSIEDDQLTTVLCEVIHKLLIPFTFDQIMSEENKTYLLQGLTHFSPEIRYLSLQQVSKCLNTDENIQAMVQSDLFPLVLVTLAFQDTKTANKASDILYSMSLKPSGQESFFGPTCLTMLKQLLQINGVISFRVYDLIIKVATISNETFEQCEASGLLSVFLSEIQSNDLLVKINAIELLNDIAATAAGITFLEKANLLDTISSILDNPDDQDVAVQLIKSAVIKFFGNLGEKQDIEYTINKYNLLERFEKCLESQNIEIITITISTIGLLGSNTKGLKLLYKTSLLSKWIELYPSFIGQVKIASIQTLSKLIGVKEQENEEIENMTFDLYKQLEEHSITLSTLIKEAKQPDDALCVASFALMQSIAYHTWGDQLMSRSTEFMNYILDRTTEYTEQGKIWKFAIIQTMSQVPNAANIFGNYYAQIQVYLRQGAYYRTVVPMAAVESS